jgi:hypothetical protein
MATTTGQDLRRIHLVYVDRPALHRCRAALEAAVERKMVVDNEPHMWSNGFMATNHETNLKPPTIRAIVRKAGFDKYTKNQVRRTHDGQVLQSASTGSGVEVKRYLDGIVRVIVHSSSDRMRRRTEEQVEQAILDAGYETRPAPGNIGILVEVAR